MRLYPNIGLAQVNEGRDKENGVRVQIANPDLIVKKKALKERVNRNPKPPLEKIFKNYDLTRTRVGVAFPFRCSPAAELLIVQQPHSNEVVEGSRAAPGFFHSLAIISALFFESLFTIDALGRTLNWVLKMAMVGGSSGKGRRFVSKCWVKGMDATSSFL